MFSSVTVQFLPDDGNGSDAFPISCVLDLDGFGAIVGIEVLSLAARAGPSVCAGIEGAFVHGGQAVRFSYDDRAFLAGAILGGFALLVCIFVWLRHPRTLSPPAPVNGSSAVGP